MEYKKGSADFLGTALIILWKLSENGPIAGGFTFDIETDRCTVIPGKGSNVLALHLMSGDVPYI
ncbi:hypothetical protein, partial [Ruminococcus sp.]|uniref:hypothetical protein n=1 Tax=Ruminococcus sp. TaxID=41978 RepID=UPI003AB8451D